MGDVFNAIILGIIEGLTEFLPISSTGHMILAQPLLGVDDADPKWRVFLFVIQVGAIGAVIVYFWRDLWKHIVLARGRKLRDHLLTKLAVAVAPAIVLGMLFNDFMEERLESGPFAPYAVAGALIVGAILMAVIDRGFRRRAALTLDDVTLRHALIIGLAQCLAMWPGTSRSMVTIMAGIFIGLPATVAAQFSFLLAIPTMLLAAAYRTWKYRADMTVDSAVIILVGSLTAFVVALLVVSGFMQYIRTRRFTPFVVYRIVLGILVLIFARQSVS